VAHALQHVGAVHARGGDAHQYFARPGLRHEARAELEHLGLARLGDFDGAHDGGESHDGFLGAG